MFQIIGKYAGCPAEVIDEAETREDAEYMLKEYKIAFGSDWRLEIKKVK